MPDQVRHDGQKLSAFLVNRYWKKAASKFVQKYTFNFSIYH